MYGLRTTNSTKLLANDKLTEKAVKLSNKYEINCGDCVWEHAEITKTIDQWKRREKEITIIH